VTNDHAAPGAGLGIRPPAYRLPDATRVGSIRLAVSDLRRSIDYYERVLGLDSRDTSDGGASLGPRGDRAFLRLETNPGLGPARPGALGLYHFAIRVPDRAALGRFAEHVTGLGVPVGAADHFVSEAIYLRDPDGLGIEIYVDRPRETWRQRGRELVMTTDPLDVSGLVAATAGKTWTGMPPGTTIGHMHLHVGGLDEAEDFYHSALGFDKTVWSYPGALFLAHNVVNKGNEMPDFLDAIENSPNLLTAIVTPSGEGISISMKRR